MKLRVTHTITRTYEPDAEHYPGCSTAEEMASVDRENYQDGDGILFDLEGDDAAVVTTVEVVEP